MTAMFDYIEAFYNPIRPHSGIGRFAPDTFADTFSQCAKSYVSL